MNDNAESHVPPAAASYAPRSGLPAPVKWLLIAAIVGLPLAVLLPVLQQSREAARRATCANRLKMIGLSLHCFLGAYRRMPTNQWDEQNGHGWSWLTYLLPAMEEGELFASLDIRNNTPYGPGPGAPNAQRARPNGFVCPSYSGAQWYDDRTPGSETGGIANYKSMGATTVESLMGYDPATAPPPPYGTREQHPDGAISYGKRLRESDFADGLSHTIIAAETIDGTPVAGRDTRAAVWHIGQTATLVGFQTAVLTPPTSAYDFYHFSGYAPDRFDSDTGVPDSVAATYLNWDYATTPYAGGYGDDEATFGPSSSHPGVVNHLFGDSRVHPISIRVDRSVYFFALTRSNADPRVPIWDLD